jgi:adenylate cyclase
VVPRFRLISGLILFAYVLTHFVNHSLGIISIAAMEAILAVVYPIWSYPPVTFLLYGALVTHMTLALYALCNVVRSNSRSMRPCNMSWVSACLCC